MDQRIKSYAEGIAARNVARAEEKGKNSIFPNLAQAAVEYDPSRGVRTGAQIAEEQRAVGGPRANALSPDTIAGLQALRAAAEAAPTPTPAQAPAPTPPPAPAAVSAAASTVAEDTEEPVDDPELNDAYLAFQRRQEQLRAERARAEANLAPIDLAEGLLHGQFSQVVPVLPGVLEVEFRSLTMLEDQVLRLKVHAEIRETPEKDRIATQILAVYQTACSVVRINKTAWPAVVSPSPRPGTEAFDQEAFAVRVANIQRLPSQVAGVLSLHAGWFEERVRALFSTTDLLKNG